MRIALPLLSLAALAVAVPAPAQTGPCWSVEPPRSQRRAERVRDLLGDLPAHVTYAPIDFATQDLATVLKGAGYDASRRTLFICSATGFLILSTGAYRVYEGESDTGAVLVGLNLDGGSLGEPGQPRDGEGVGVRFLQLVNRLVDQEFLELAQAGLPGHIPGEAGATVPRGQAEQGGEDADEERHQDCGAEGRCARGQDPAHQHCEVDGEATRQGEGRLPRALIGDGQVVHDVERVRVIRAESFG